MMYTITYISNTINIYIYVHSAYITIHNIINYKYIYIYIYICASNIM